MLHVMQAQPLSGGQLLGNGRMWVSPCGEVDPRAVKVRFEGRNLPTETLLKRYLPKVCRLLSTFQNVQTARRGSPKHPCVDNITQKFAQKLDGAHC